MSSEAGFWNASPKTTFTMGLILGLLVSAIAALIVILSMLLGGGGLPRSPIAVVPEPPLPGDPTPVPPSAPPKEVDSSDHVRGNKNAKVTLIEYSDFECPFCKTHVPSVEQALKDFPKDVRLVYRHYPLSFHQNAQKEAEASECVAKLGGNDAFWKFHDKIFTETTSNGTGFALDKLGPAAAAVGVNQQKFQSCLDSGETRTLVDEDMTSGNNSGVQGTPATFVNDKLVSGAVPYSVLKAEIVAAGAKS